MFEDSTFETMGRIRTRSRRWMVATFALNGSILLALVVIPLIYPEALPSQYVAFLMTVPSAPTPEPKPQTPPPNATIIRSEMSGAQVIMPRQIPIGLGRSSGPEVVFPTTVADMGPVGDGSGGDNPFAKQRVLPAVRPATSGPTRLPSSVSEGLLLSKSLPHYPPIAVAARIQGTVVLQATISKGGTIENLRVAGGPAMLQQAALDAVKTWRYRPYLLNGEPVEVETTVNVVFNLAH
jgi:protein TonB